MQEIFSAEELRHSGVSAVCAFVSRCMRPWLNQPLEASCNAELLQET